MKRVLTIMLLPLLALSVFATGAKETRTVELWHSNTGKVGEAFENIINDFNETVGKENGVYVEAIYQGKANDVLTKVKASSGANTLPDIAQMDATSGLDMNNADYIVTIDELGLDTSSVLEIAKTGFKSERGLIALPFNSSALLLYYNKTLFDSLGLVPPKTMDEMVDVANALKGKIDYAFAGVPATSELTTFLGAQNSISYMTDNENGHKGKATKVLFGENGTYKAFLEKWKAIYETGSVNNITQGVSTEFAASRCAMMLASSSNLSTIIANVDNTFEVGVAEVPMVDENATGGVCVGGGALYAFENNEDVKLVLEYLTSADVQLKWAEGTGYIPLNTKLYDSEEYKAFLSLNPDFSIAMDAILKSNPQLTNVWLPSAYQIYYSFQQNIKDVITGKLTVDEGVKEMADYVQKALDA